MSVAIYLDHNATTPVDPAVRDAMLPFLGETFGNPSSVHSFGQQARRALDTAREQVAALIGADPAEIVFTSGGTESNNHAIRGAYEAGRHRGRKLLTTAIEHQAVLGPCEGLEADGARVTYLGVDGSGTVDPAEAITAMTAETVLISVMTANNDVGAIQPVEPIARAARERGITAHSDAVQALGKIPIHVAEFDVDLLSLSAHKLYGPMGAGALYIRERTRVAPILRGGHHESRRRAGTENLPAIVGFGVACELAASRFRADAQRISALRDRLQAGLDERIERVIVHAHSASRLPGTLSVGFDGVEGEALMFALDIKGIAVSTGSACTSDNREPSHVLVAMGCTPAAAMNAIRFSLGRENTTDEIDQTVATVTDVVARLREL